MTHVINISKDIYPVHELLADLDGLRDKISDLVIFVQLKNDDSYVAHSGVSLSCMALVCQSVAKNFNDMITEKMENPHA